MPSRPGLPMMAVAALLLPAIIVLAVWFNTQQEERRAEVEREAMAMAQRVLAQSTAEATASARMLRLLAISPAVTSGDAGTATALFDLTRVANPAWQAIVLRDRQSGNVLAQSAARADGRPLATPRAAANDRIAIGGATREGRYCPCVMMDAIAGDRRITVFVTPEVFQRILIVQASTSAVAALVDKNGNFITRSLDAGNRFGRPGSKYLRDAAARGGEGIYSGFTLEGAATYTAYVSAPEIGWSAHVAVNRSAIDDPKYRAIWSVAVALLAALALAAGLSLYAAYETRRRKQEEERLIGMQKAEAISRFTSTMTHDFRNILAVVDAGARLIRRQAPDDQVTKLATAISEAVGRGNRLVNQMLSFARGDGAEVVPVDLRKLIDGADELIARAVGEEITVRCEIAEDARMVMANADQLELALLNLAVNARDAMEGVGTFAIEARRKGGMTEISAQDSGPGVPKILRDRIFEAFYSTKESGKGTGLGLAQVAGAARQAGGSVALRDTDGGACFVISLPVAPSADQPER